MHMHTNMVITRVVQDSDLNDSMRRKSMLAIAEANIYFFPRYTR